MAFKLPSMVRETSITVGAGTLTLEGVIVPGYELFSANFSNGDTTLVTVKQGDQYECFRATYTAGTLAKTEMLASSNANAAVAWPGGTLDVYVGLPGLTDLSAAAMSLVLELLLRPVEVAVASAATCDILGAASGKVEVTGTTTITSFGTGLHKLRLVRFSGALTLTHNATTLILPGGANITTAAGDTCIVTSDGSSNVRVRSYTRGAVAPLSAAVILALLLTVDGAGSTLDADLLDGVSSAAFAQLAVANTFSVVQTVEIPTGAAALTLRSTAAGSIGPILDITHFSASPAASDLMGIIRFNGYDSAAALVNYLQLYGMLLDPTAGSTDAEYQFNSYVAGAYGLRMAVGAGARFGAPTGGDKGIGTTNAVGQYDDNVLLTCQAMQEEYLQHGRIDIAFWEHPDRLPPIVTPASTEQRPVIEEVVVTRRVMVLDKDRRPVRNEAGGFVSKVETVTEKRQIIDLMPVFDEDGMTGVDAIEVPAVEWIEHPEVATPREHKIARLFQRMIDDGFDPRDPHNYIRRMDADHQLPGLPTLEPSVAGQWEQNALPVGEIASRMWLAIEFLALAFRGYVKLTDARLAALESVAPEKRRG